MVIYCKLYKLKIFIAHVKPPIILLIFREGKKVTRPIQNHSTIIIINN